MSATFEAITGRYVHLSFGGRTHRIYFEEAGAGSPLVCLHTAGSDGRQFREILGCRRITDRFRVIAFDLPWHGKSSPHEGWQDVDYALDAQSYTDSVLGFIDALKLDRPILMGCSIGGRIVLHMALDHPHRFRALIGLQSAARTKPFYDLNWLHHPDVHGEVCAAVVSGLIAPTSPDNHRWETLWHYMQGGPGVFKGDLAFYRADADLLPRLEQVDTSKCPLYLLTGAYDYSCSPADTHEAAAKIKGARVTIMPDLGHFPMSENPDLFLTHLLPILDEVHRTGMRGRALQQGSQPDGHSS